MWYIRLKNECDSTLIRNIFHNKQDAFKHIRNTMKLNSYSDVDLINGDLELVSPNIVEQSLLQIVEGNKTLNYGIIDEITNYLVMIKKDDGSIVEFTKNRLNKEFVLGNFKIQPKN